MLQDSKKVKMMKGEQANPSPKFDAKKQPCDGKGPWSCWVTNQQSLRQTTSLAQHAWKPNAQPNLNGKRGAKDSTMRSQGPPVEEC
eukprot:4105453-Amphidinium_carterae.1